MKRNVSYLDVMVVAHRLVLHQWVDSYCNLELQAEALEEVDPMVHQVHILVHLDMEPQN